MPFSVIELCVCEQVKRIDREGEETFLCIRSKEKIEKFFPFQTGNLAEEVTFATALWKTASGVGHIEVGRGEARYQLESV